MLHQSPHSFVRLASAAALAVVATIPCTGWAVDWGKSAATEIALFYPGQMSWEKTLTAAAHKGATKFRAGETCHGCHADEEADMGASQAGKRASRGRSSA